jgi:hypothetical protein
MYTDIRFHLTPTSAEVRQKLAVFGKVQLYLVIFIGRQRYSLSLDLPPRLRSPLRVQLLGLSYNKYT